MPKPHCAMPRKAALCAADKGLPGRARHGLAGTTANATAKVKHHHLFFLRKYYTVHSHNSKFIGIFADG